MIEAVYTWIVDVDAAVIGGGIVGLACASAFARGGKRTVVLERHRRVATETTSRNSEVIHAGLYYPRASLKAITCVRGAELAYAWCVERGVPHARCGKLVVASSEEEVEALEALAVRARDNGARVEMISREAARAIEPEVLAVAALDSPNTGIVDSHAFAASLAADVDAHGGVIALGRRVVAVEHVSDRLRLVCDGVAGREVIDAAHVVNAAGLYADEIASMFGFEIRQRFVKGTYFRCSKKIVKRLVYPMPPKDGAGLGIHATVDLGGGVRFGPDTSPARSREDYEVDETRRADFFRAAVRYLPNLREENLTVDMCGIRPKVDTGDFIVEKKGAVVHLVGIESPGLTAALAIAERVAMLLP